MPHSALGHLLPPPSQPLDLQVISSAHSAGSQSSHAVGLAHPKSNSPRVSNPSATLTWFSRLAKAIARGVAAVACDSFEEPQAAQFLFQGFCARIQKSFRQKVSVLIQRLFSTFKSVHVSVPKCIKLLSLV